MKETFAFPLISPDGVSQNLGMTIRDYIAIHALQGILANGGVNGHIDGKGDTDNSSVWAYEYADAMIEMSNNINKL
jgi:hypothetical protein